MWETIPRCERLVEVSHHDHLMHSNAPAHELCIDFTRFFVLWRGCSVMVEASGHVDRDNESEVSFAELEHRADQAACARSLVAADARGQREREKESDASAMA
jgi:hypothetical protein